MTGSSTPQPSEPVELAPVESAGQDVALSQLADGRQAMLRSLKDLGEATVQQLAGSLGVTAGAIRQHERALERLKR